MSPDPRALAMALEIRRKNKRPKPPVTPETIHETELEDEPEVFEALEAAAEQTLEAPTPPAPVSASRDPKSVARAILARRKKALAPTDEVEELDFDEPEAQVPRKEPRDRIAAILSRTRSAQV